LIVLSVGLTSQAASSAATVAKKTPSIKQLLGETESAFSSASSVGITGYIRDGKVLEEVDIAVLSDGDGSYSFKIKSARAQLTIVAGAAYFEANAAYLQKYGRYSASEAAAYAGQWIQEGSLDADNLTANLSFNSILNSFANFDGKLTRTTDRRLNGVRVLGLHSSKSGYLYIARSAIAYPVELQYQKKALHEVLRFSGWNAQPEPNVPASDIKVGSNQSDNWSGYVLPTASGSVTQVEGDWTVPTANCASTPNAFSSSWVGIDGQMDSQVLQTGTETDCVKGQQLDYGWFENYPSPPVGLDIAVHSGDVISGELVEVAPGYWSYTLTDLTSGQVVTSPSPIAYQGPGSSAEWIEEDPGDQVHPLTDFGTIDFSGLSVNGSTPIMDPSDNSLNMVQNGQLEAQPSQFGNDVFSVAYQ
jgi:Peptidase A4 family